MKHLIFLALVAMLFTCNNQSNEKNTSNDEENQQTTNEVDESKIGRKNFAIVWKWKTKDLQLMDENLGAVGMEMNKLWEDDIIENLYFNKETGKENEYFPNISSFLKANTLKDAQNILKNLILVKKEMADYSIYPVGAKWLGRKPEAVKERGATKSYVAVWSNEKELNQTEDAKIIDTQSAAIMELWNKGAVENVYFDVAGTLEANDVTDFVFFVNANSENEAREICDNLPFAKENIASYKLALVGVFWLGQHEDNK